jgi:hypothetical protein
MNYKIIYEPNNFVDYDKIIFNVKNRFDIEYIYLHLDRFENNLKMFANQLILLIAIKLYLMLKKWLSIIYE